MVPVSLYHVKEHCEDILREQKGDTSIAFRQISFKTENGTLLIDIIFKQEFFLSMEFGNKEHLVSEYQFKFTKREADIIDGIIQGKNNPQLAAALSLSGKYNKNSHPEYLSEGRGQQQNRTYLYSAFE